MAAYPYFSLLYYHAEMSFLTNFAFLSVLEIPGIMIGRNFTNTTITKIVMKQTLTPFSVNQIVKMNYNQQDNDFLYTQSILPLLHLFW